jgi:hypothetical protein
MFSEARLSAILVSVLTGAGVVLIMGQAFRDVVMGLYFGIPVAIGMALVLSLFASDGVKKKQGEKPSKGE